MVDYRYWNSSGMPFDFKNIYDPIFFSMVGQFYNIKVWFLVDRLFLSGADKFNQFPWHIFLWQELEIYYLRAFAGAYCSYLDCKIRKKQIWSRTFKYLCGHCSCYDSSCACRKIGVYNKVFHRNLSDFVVFSCLRRTFY